MQHTQRPCCADPHPCSTAAGLWSSLLRGVLAELKLHLPCRSSLVWALMLGGYVGRSSCEMVHTVFVPAEQAGCQCMYSQLFLVTQKWCRAQDTVKLDGFLAVRVPVSTLAGCCFVAAHASEPCPVFLGRLLVGQLVPVPRKGPQLVRAPPRGQQMP